MKKRYQLSGIRFIIFLLIAICGGLGLSNAQNSKSYPSNGLHFDGMNDFVEANNIGSLLNNLDTFTIEFIVKIDTNDQQTGGHRALFAVNKPSNVGENELLIVLGNNGNAVGKVLIFDDNASSGAFEITSQSKVGDNQCHHVAYIRENDSGYLYIDGTFEGVHHIGYQIDSTKRFSIGQDWDRALPSDFVNGIFSEFRVWRSARTSSQLKSEQNATAIEPQSDLLVYYPFNQGVAGQNNAQFTRIYDLSGNALHGSLQQFSLSGNTSNWVKDSCLSVDPCIYRDTIEVRDTVTLNDTNFVSISDTVIVRINDTLTFIDTLIHIDSFSYIDTTVYIDTSFVTVLDTSFITISDTNFITVIDTQFLTIRDTIPINITVYDTVLVRVNDTLKQFVSVSDTLRIPISNIQGCGTIDVKLYPNPARNFVYLEVSDFDCMVLSHFNLYNSIGQVLWTDQLIEDEVIKIPIHQLAAGVYYVDCLDSLRNRMFVKKLVLYK
jgi:hypothetical protein